MVLYFPQTQARFLFESCFIFVILFKWGWKMRIRAPVVGFNKDRINILFNNKNMMNCFRLSRIYVKYHKPYFIILFPQTHQSEIDGRWPVYRVVCGAACCFTTTNTTYLLTFECRAETARRTVKEKRLIQLHVDFVTLCFYVSPHLFFSLLNASCVLSECISEACHRGFKANVYEKTLKCHDKVQATVQKACQLTVTWDQQLYC